MTKSAWLTRNRIVACITLPNSPFCTPSIRSLGYHALLQVLGDTLVIGADEVGQRQARFVSSNL